MRFLRLWAFVPTAILLILTLPAVGQEPDSIDRQIRNQAPGVEAAETPNAEAAEDPAPPVEVPRDTPTKTFSDQVVVGEAELLAQLPVDLTIRLPVDVSRMTLTIDGTPRRLLRAEPLGRGEARVLVVFDHDLSRDESLSLAALALAQRAEELTALGPVTVMALGDGAGARTLVDTTREARILQNALSDEASRLRREGQWMAGPPRYPGPPDTLWADLATLGETTAQGGPQFLFLVSDGFFPAADEMATWNRTVDLDTVAGNPPSNAPARGLAVRRAALRLATAGWVVIPLSLRREELKHGSAPPPEIVYPDGSPSKIFIDFSRVYSYLRGHGKAKYERGYEDPRTAEAAWLPELAPLQELASQTSGAVVRYEDFLSDTLASLRNRWRVWYEATELPDHPVSVELLRIDRGNEIRARKWLAATP